MDAIISKVRQIIANRSCASSSLRANNFIDEVDCAVILARVIIKLDVY